MEAYDLDGVIAILPEMAPHKKWGKMNGIERNEYRQTMLMRYMNAEPMIRPKGEFIIVTARKNESETMFITQSWLTKHGIEPKAIHYLNTGRTIENVSKFKANVINHYNAKNFYEDNLKVIKGMMKWYADCQYHYYKDGKFTLVSKS